MADPRDDERFAVVDLGSNSFRLVVFTDHAPRAGSPHGWWKRTDEIYEPIRIGAGLDESGALAKDAMRRAGAAVDVFAHFAQAAGIKSAAVDVVATSAIREATNSAAFVRKVERQSGLDVRVLSRDDEARYGYVAAVNSTTLKDGVMVDLGGGSMQLVQVGERCAQASESWRLGAVAMTERFLPSREAASEKQLARLREHVAHELSSARWLNDAGRQLVGIGGTVRNLAAAVQRALGVPRFGVQGFAIPRAALDELVERLAQMPADQRAAIPGIKPARGDIILAGAVVLQSVMECGGFGTLETTEAGLREGVFFERHLAGLDAPLFADVRRESVQNLSAQYDAGYAHVTHVATLALGLFDELAAAGLCAPDPLERELLWAAAQLHDIGVAVDYDDHHQHSRYLVLSAGLPGFTPREVALIGQAVRYHRKGIPSLGPFAPLMHKSDHELLTRCAVLLRLAEGLERGRDQVVSAARIARTRDGAVELTLVADDGAALPRWAASREAGLFERAYGAPLVVA